MPENCNGLTRLDDDIDFCKINCRWDISHKGKLKHKKLQDLPRKKSGIKNAVPVCLTLEKDLLDYIKSQALQQSMSEGVYIEPNELMRQALIRAFPCPKQYDMFGNKK